MSGTEELHDEINFVNQLGSASSVSQIGEVLESFLEENDEVPKLGDEINEFLKALFERLKEVATAELRSEAVIASYGQAFVRDEATGSETRTPYQILSNSLDAVGSNASYFEDSDAAKAIISWIRDFKQENTV